VLPADHTYEQALDALSQPLEVTPGGVSRRRFLQGLGAAGVLAASPAFAGRVAAAPGAPPSGPPNLVVFTLGGGNDGLSTLQPSGETLLDWIRPNLLLPRAALLPLADGWGMHPALPNLHAAWGRRELAVVGSVGASGNLSHFDSIAEWFCAGPTPSGGALAGTGFLGRWLDTHDDFADAPLRAVSLTTNVPLLLIGQRTAGCGLSTGSGYMIGDDRSNAVVSDLFNGVEVLGDRAIGDASAHGFVARLGATSVRLAARLGPAYAPPVSTGSAMVDQATVAARFLNDASLGCQVVHCSFGSFDLHVDLPLAQFALLGELDRAVGALFAGLQPDVAARTALLVHSEFGRRTWANPSAGADHGTASYAFVMGPGVDGGRVYGEHLAVDRFDAYGSPPITVRHLDLLGTIMGDWMGADPASLFGTPTSSLGLFRAGARPRHAHDP
jgi:uncharacterized protein (DUF1501 family)